MLEIVRFQESDIDTVYEIQRTAYKPLYEKYRDDDLNPYMESKETVLQKYTRPGTVGYLFFLQKMPVGTVRVTLYPHSKSGKISALGVHPQYQGQGIAQQALLKIEEIHADVERWFLDTILPLCESGQRLGTRKNIDLWKKKFREV